MTQTDQAGGMRRSVVLRHYPDGAPRERDFALVEEPIPPVGPGEVLTRTLFLSIDPYMRGRLSTRKSYAPPVRIGEVMTGETVGEVLASDDPRLPVGSHAVGARGWSTHLVTPAKHLAPVPSGGAPLSTYLGVLGMPGTTAYSGLTDIGQPKHGETVVVSAATGAVGSVAAQLAKRAGARVVGIAGGPDKCLYAQEELGLDACVDHRAGSLASALADACPNGIDVYFENVGGAVQAAVFPQLNPFARVVMCGMVAQYNEASPDDGPNLGFVVGKRVRIQGLIVTDNLHRFAEWRALAAPWVADGSLRYREDIHDGLDAAAAAFIGMLSGGNFGKLLVRVAA